MRKLKADKILDQIKELNKELEAHQSKCKHTKVIEVTDDYGTTTTCGICKLSRFTPRCTYWYDADQ
jgi:hypothetical protein